MPGRADDELFEDGHANFENLMFGFAYTVNSKDRGITQKKVVLAKLVLEFLQLFLLACSPNYGFVIDKGNK